MYIIDQSDQHTNPSPGLTIHQFCNMSETVIRKLNSAITIFSIPFSRMGLPIGNRSTGIKLKNNDVFVLVSSPPDEPTKKTLDEMGRVA